MSYTFSDFLQISVCFFMHKSSAFPVLILVENIQENNHELANSSSFCKCYPLDKIYIAVHFKTA